VDQPERAYVAKHIGRSRDALEQVFDRVYGSGEASTDGHSANANKKMG
jgi:hypothetical protein